MHAKLYCMTNPEDRCAFHNDLCLDVYTIDRTTDIIPLNCCLHLPIVLVNTACVKCRQAAVKRLNIFHHCAIYVVLGESLSFVVVVLLWIGWLVVFGLTAF